MSRRTDKMWGTAMKVTALAPKTPKVDPRFVKFETEWVATVYSVGATEIDPNFEHDWRSLKYGWALAKGLQIDEALDFAWQGAL